MVSFGFYALAQVVALSKWSAHLLRGITLRMFLAAGLFGTVIVWNSYALATHQGASWWHADWIWLCVFAAAIIAALNIRDALLARANAQSTQRVVSAVRIYAKGRP